MWKSTRWIWLWLLWLTPCAMAGTPAIDGYEDFAAFAGRVRKLDAHADATVTALAKSAGGREVLLITISQGDAAAKPAILFVGSIHAPQLVGSEVAVRLAEKLTSDDARAVELRKQFTFYIVPRPNPDASEAFFAAPLEQRTTNLRPHDDDHDGRTDEDGPNDLNGDGLITMMRVEDPAGTWMPHPEDPRILIEADRAKGERGVYKLYTEGGDEDGDEQFNEDGIGGVAYDRNFTFDYEYFAADVGPNQVSEPEMRALVDFAFDRTNIAAVFSIGVNDNLATPWKAADQSDRIKTQLLKADGPVMEKLAERFKELFGTEGAPSPGNGKGSLVKWAYFHYGRYSVQSPGWWPPKVEAKKAEEKPAAEGEQPAEAQPPAEKAEEKKEEKKKSEDRAKDQIAALKYFDTNGIAGFVDWVDAAAKGLEDKKVQVGGFRPFVRLNPPAAMLDDIASKHFELLTTLADMLPKIAIADVKVEALGGNVYRLTATFANDGAMPTMSAMGRANNIPFPLNITLDVPEDAKLLIGHRRVQIENIEPHGGRAEHMWLIRTDAASATLSVTSPAVGSDRKEITLR